MKMSVMGARLPLWQKRLVTGAVALAWLSGLGLFLVKMFGASNGEFGFQRHGLESPLRAVHGAVVMAVLVAVGSVLAAHVRAGWDTGLRRRSAFFTVAAVLVLAGTGWGLYYLSHEQARNWVGWIHAGAGLGLAPLFWIHSRRRDPF